MKENSKAVSPDAALPVSRAALAAPLSSGLPDLSDALDTLTLMVARPLSKMAEIEFYGWLIPFSVVFATKYEKLGFPKPISDAVTNDAEWANYFLLRDGRYASVLRLVKRVRVLFFEGNQQNQETPTNPGPVTEPEVPKGELVPGVYKRTLDLVAQIRKSQAFNKAMATELGLDWKTPGKSGPIDPKLEAYQDKDGAKCRWNKDGRSNVAAYFEYDPTGQGEEANFAHLLTATKSPVSLVQFLPKDVQTAVWALRFCIIEDNKPTEVWSNVVKVTVSRVINSGR